MVIIIIAIFFRVMVLSLVIVWQNYSLFVILCTIFIVKHLRHSIDDVIAITLVIALELIFFPF